MELNVVREFHELFISKSFHCSQFLLLTLVDSSWDLHCLYHNCEWDNDLSVIWKIYIKPKRARA